MTCSCLFEQEKFNLVLISDTTKTNFNTFQSLWHTLIFVIIIADNSDLHEYIVIKWLKYSKSLQTLWEILSQLQGKIHLIFFFMKLKSATQTAIFKTNNSNAAIQRYTNLILTCWRMAEVSPELLLSRTLTQMHKVQQSITFNSSIWAGVPGGIRQYYLENRTLLLLWFAWSTFSMELLMGSLPIAGEAVN